MPTYHPSLVRRLARQLRIAARFLIPPTAATFRSREPTPVVSTHRLPRPIAPRRSLLPVVAAWLFTAQSAFAATIYVDSRLGNDGFDGLSAEQVSSHSGPVRTLHKAVTIVHTGDQIVMANNGSPYFGGLALYGLQQSGSPRFPIEIVGNGCLLNGTKLIDRTTWRMVDSKTWRITPQRKGWYQLVLSGVALPETPVPEGSVALPPLVPGNWCAFEGAIYYAPPLGREPAELPLELADEQTGLTLVAVENIVIRDLTIQHFRQDGINLHDRCRNIVLRNVTCQENGRAGIVVSGTSSVQLENVTCQRNREASLLVEDLGVADATGSTFEPRPEVRQ
jgi:hypothetical protein